MADREPTTSREPSHECEAAIRLGTALLAARQMDPAAYKLIAAENLIRGALAVRPHAWRLTFKPRRLIPDSAEAELGAGGEVFIEVDLTTGQAKLTGYGE